MRLFLLASMCANILRFRFHLICRLNNHVKVPMKNLPLTNRKISTVSKLLSHLVLPTLPEMKMTKGEANSWPGSRKRPTFFAVDVRHSDEGLPELCRKSLVISFYMMKRRVSISVL